MAQNSKIEWTDHTVNLWHGCTKVHEGCDNCYAETLARRWGNDIWGNDKPRKQIKSAFLDLDKYQDLAKKEGRMHRVFVGSMMDIFEKSMPMIDSKGSEIEGVDTRDLRDQFFLNISNHKYDNLMFLLLTKRPSNINKYIPESWFYVPPSNVMFGTSPVNQSTYDNLIKHMNHVHGQKFLSIEPQLGDIDLGPDCQVDWIIQGGESGHGKRPFSLDWAVNMRRQCDEQKIPYFFKQIDKVQQIPDQHLVRETPWYK